MFERYVDGPQADTWAAEAHALVDDCNELGVTDPAYSADYPATHHAPAFERLGADIATDGDPELAKRWAQLDATGRELEVAPLTETERAIINFDIGHRYGQIDAMALSPGAMLDLCETLAAWVVGGVIGNAAYQKAQQALAAFLERAGVGPPLESPLDRSQLLAYVRQYVASHEPELERELQDFRVWSYELRNYNRLAARRTWVSTSEWSFDLRDETRRLEVALQMDADERTPRLVRFAYTIGRVGLRGAWHVEPPPPTGH